MENESFKIRHINASAPLNLQEKFNTFIRKYNDDFLFFLRRAASGYYDCLVTSGRTLKDLHELIIFIQSATSGLQFEVIPLPFTFRHGTEYYRLLGFNDEEIANIHGFFDYVKKTYNKDFEECMSEETEFPCSKS